MDEPRGKSDIGQVYADWLSKEGTVTMAYIPKAVRDKIPAEDFGDPERRLYPVRNQQDLDDAAHLIGKAKDPEAVKRRLIAIARRKGLKIPDAWQSKAESGGTARMSVVEFDEGGRYVDGDWAIYPNAKLFEAGEYSDKEFTLSPEEMQIAVDNFSPVGGNIEHLDFLHGKACEVRSVRLDDSDPYILRGEVAVPLWLDENLEPHRKKLSAEWDRTEKVLSGVALTATPRVSDAALMSAYAEFAGRRHSATDQQQLQEAHDAIVRAGAECSPSNAHMSANTDIETQAKKSSNSTTSTKEKKTMSFMDRLREALTGATPEELAEFSAADSGSTSTTTTSQPPPSGPTPEPAPAPQPAPSGPALMPAEFAQLQQEVAALKAEKRLSTATSEVDKFIQAAKLVPAQRQAAIAAFSQAMLDDEAHAATVSFSDGQTDVPFGSRVAALQAVFSGQPAHGLFSERIPAGETLYSVPSFSTGGKADEDAEARKRELLSLTPLGKSVLDNHSNGN